MTTPNTHDQSAEGAASEAPKGSMDRFKSLAKGLLNVPRSKMAEAEAIYQDGKDKRRA
jgi:hypothetical protein